jgi:hypothetical protein
MSAPNGHAQQDHAPASGQPPAMPAPGVLQLPAERVKELVAALEGPFDPWKVEWRVMNTTKGQQPACGQVVPYADQRAYTDRLNALFTPAGWTRKYTIHTSANFERSKDQKIVAKVLVTCELTIFAKRSKKKFWRTCKQPNGDYAEPRLREGRRVWQLSRQFLGL